LLAAAPGSLIRDHLVPILVLGVIYVYVVLAVARWRGPLYGVPLAIAGGLAFDSFYIPPTREFGAADWQNWLVVAIYLVMGVLIGMLGALSGRRAKGAEEQRGVLAEEQAALRRVATLVARGAPPQTVFGAVADEVGQVLSVEQAALLRYEADETATVVADRGGQNGSTMVGRRLPIDGHNVTARVFRTRRTIRIDDYTGTGALGAQGRERRVRSAVGSPIFVEGGLWGALIAGTDRTGSLPADVESRIEEFTELVATAVSNLQARSELAASRERIVVATDEERRRVVRDLHDGAQQRLVHVVVTLNMARRALETEDDRAPTLVAEALQHAEAATEELRELAHGILPSVLTHGGLRAGVGALATRIPVPVETGVSVDRFPPAVEATAYLTVAEALTNVAKHSRADRVAVTARLENGELLVEVRDDGVGGAKADGSGLLGLSDRLAVLDGKLRVESPVGGGTLVAATIPLLCSDFMPEKGLEPPTRGVP
jgi:signal transduction histidine kinase